MQPLFNHDANYASIFRREPAYDPPPCSTRGTHHVRHRRRRQHAQHRPDPGRRPEAASSTAATTPAASRCTRAANCGARAAPRAWPNSTRQVAAERIAGGTGIAHTRWATHGAPAVHNAHPHFSPAGPDATRAGIAAGRIALVHNGIIENHDELRAELKARGYAFDSQTDTEVIAHLVDHLYDGDLFEAVQRAVPRLRGAYAIAVFCRDEPHRVVGARAGLAAGARRRHRRRRELPRLRRDGAGRRHRPDRLPRRRRRRRPAARQALDQPRRAPTARFRSVQREVRTVQAHTGAAELGPYRHYMQKEIFEQPRAIADTLDAVPAIRPELFGDGAYRRVQGRSTQVLILACGTSYYARLGRQVLARVASPTSRRRSRSPANTATATACRTRARWSSRSRRAARPPTRWPR